MEDEYAGGNGPGHGCLFSRDVCGSRAWGWEGRCSVQPEPVCIPRSSKEPGEGNGRWEGPQPQPLCSAQPQSILKLRASAAPSGIRVEARSKAAPGRARGKGSLIRYAPGQTAKLTGMWRCALPRGRPRGGKRKWAWPGGREATYERSPLPMKGLPRRGGAGLLQLWLCRCISPQGAANSSGTPWPQQAPALNS